MTRHANIAKVDIAIMEKLREQRLKREITQAEIVERLQQRGVEINQPGLSRAEKGQRGFTFAEVLEYARALDMTLDDVMTEGPEDQLIAEARSLSRSAAINQKEASRINNLVGQDSLKVTELIARLENAIDVSEPGSYEKKRLREELSVFRDRCDWLTQDSLRTRISDLLDLLEPRPQTSESIN